MGTDLPKLLEELAAPPGSPQARLIEQLINDGASTEEIRAAHRESRLTLLPLERALADEGRQTLAEIAGRHDLAVRDLAMTRGALGVSVEENKPVHGRAMEQHAEHLRAALDAGLPTNQIVTLNRVIGRAAASVAAACRDAMLPVLAEIDSESERALQLAAAARSLVPVLKEVLAEALDAHMNELVKQQASAALLSSGSRVAVQPVAVGFVDATGFTRLGQTSPPQKLAGLAEVLEQLADDALEPEVQLVKTIGDALMLASSSADAIVASIVVLLHAAAEHRSDSPALHAGAAWGPAMARAGDWYGRSVNLASRLSDLAEPGTCLIDHDLLSMLSWRRGWRDLGRQHVDGFDLPIHTYAMSPCETRSSSS